MADNAFIDKVQLAIAARPGNRSGVPDAISGFEQAYVGAGGAYHADSVPSEDFHLAGRGRGAPPDLGIHRIDRYGPYFHQDVSALRGRVGEGDFGKGVWVFDGQTELCVGIADGFHLISPEVRHAS